LIIACKILDLVPFSVPKSGAESKEKDVDFAPDFS